MEVHYNLWKLQVSCECKNPKNGEEHCEILATGNCDRTGSFFCSHRCKECDDLWPSLTASAQIHWSIFFRKVADLYIVTPRLVKTFKKAKHDKRPQKEQGSFSWLYRRITSLNVGSTTCSNEAAIGWSSSKVYSLGMWFSFRQWASRSVRLHYFLCRKELVRIHFDIWSNL